MISILYEDPYILAVNKPAGLISEHNDYESNSLEDQVKNHLELSKKKAFIGIIHRLDRVTSGIMLFAKKKRSLVAFNQLFETKRIQKTYHALVDTLPVPSEGNLSNFLFKNNLEKRADVVHSGTLNAKLAKLVYKQLQSQNDSFLLEIKPTTGRFHQIRAQLAHINAPIIGDIKYGSERDYPFEGIALHAYSLQFIHPFLDSKKKLTITAPYPLQKFWLQQV